MLKLLSGLLLCLLLPMASAVTVTVSEKASHKIPELLWGLMYEDISYSGDGGLYGELLQNRAFQLVTPGTPESLKGWKPLNGGDIAVIKEESPVSSRLPNALRLAVPKDTKGTVGFANTGYSGLKVTSRTKYKASFYYRFPTRTSFSGSFTVQLLSAAGEVLATAQVPAKGSQTKWSQVVFDLVAGKTPASTDNLFAISVDGAAASGQVIHFAMLSLFPPTYKNRQNGMRTDLAETLVDLAPSFFRFPGGNNLEGQTVERRWQWNATVGPMTERPGRLGDWTYVNTDGLGLLEYLYWCEDIKAEPIMGVWAGYTLSGISVPEEDLGPYVQQAIDQINFAIGDPKKSAAAALRASLGRPKPFSMRYVEIGNEDWFAPDTYIYRWKVFYTALQKEFPQLTFIATTWAFNPVLTPGPTHYDHHVYSTPTWFAQNSFFYDDVERNGTYYFEGEYGAISTNPDDLFGTPANGRLVYPTMQSAAGEAAFMTGLERNSDIVFAAAFAPLIGHYANNQWTPNLIAFDAGNVYKSTSYYVQQFFSVYRGDEYLPSTLPERKGDLFWTVVRKKKQLFIKVVNVAATAGEVNFVLPFKKVAKTGTAKILSGLGTRSNTPTDPTGLVPRTVSIETGQKFTFVAPSVSVSVLILEAQ